ncbi:MAG: DUF4390 domain-containing protein [Deltaproteobacteria bacterium]|nr:DUF4390 domain-containing protein [Deltaproteobacteria bacterium]
MKRTLFFVFILLFLSLHFLVKSSYCVEGKVTQLNINKNQVEATIKTENCFNYDLEEIIFNGIPVKILFDIKLLRHSPYWFDQEISSLKINHVIKYDNLKDLFVIHYSDKDKPAVKVDDLIEAESLVSSVNNLIIVTEKDLSPEDNYYITYNIEIKADTENSHLPFYLKIFPWWSQESE